MLFRPVILATFVLASRVLAQDTLSSEDTDGLFLDFPQQCMDQCQAMEEIVMKCSSMAESTPESETLACVCDGEFISSLETCGSCVVPAAGLPSESGNVVLQLATSASRECGKPVNIQGIEDPEISSLLASPSAGTFTLSQTQGQSTTTAPSMSTTSSSSPSSTTSNSASSTSSPSSSGSPSQTASADNGANSLRLGLGTALAGLLVAGLVMSTNRQPIPNTGSLKDRIKKLNLDSPTHPSTSSPSSGSNSGPPSPTAVRTGATTKISDKISRFQVNAEQNPLLPSGGSFGLAPARPSGFKDRNNEKRVASLGAGRAPVPLNAVSKSTRSVSAGNVANGSRSTSENGSVGSGQGREKSGSVGSREGQDSRPSTPSGTGSTGETLLNDTPSTSNGSTNPLLDNQQLSNLLAPGPRTPGAMSVSSMHVETGSVASEGERHPSELDSTPSLIPTDTLESTGSLSLNSIKTPTSAASVASSFDDGPPTPPSIPVKGPLDHLRQPSRSGSIASLSSLVVEAPPEDVADLGAMSNSGRPSITSGGGGGESEPRTIVTAAPTDDGNGVEEEGDEKRLERTNEELKEYENDEQDPTAHGPGPEEEGGLPVRPTWDADYEGGGVDDGGAMPKVKCSDCDASVDLVELADHTCAPTGRNQHSRISPDSAPPDSTSPVNTHPHLSEEGLEDASPTPLAGSAILDPVSTPERNPSNTSEKLDDYVPQTSRVVPDDIAPEDEEEEEENDVLDFYGEEEDRTHSSHSQNADVPPDLDDDELNHEANGSSVMSRSHSQPTTRAQKEPSGPRSHSVYLPGHYDEDEDEGYQGGTVTIVQSSR
ncbi:uncharacterized protein JCM6883_002792 [Sporobolomyces salmoneus]|uniref:uncharacterized protein n=1 Tax=Sporobolomyces salmoneus TaxID=183962 RepID=UPI003180ED32